jgi:hypothetical protein
MKVVRFDNGRYGIRKWTLFGYMYRDMNLKYISPWWSRAYREVYCEGSLDQVMALYHELKSKRDRDTHPHGVPVNVALVEMGGESKYIDVDNDPRLSETSRSVLKKRGRCR